MAHWYRFRGVKFGTVAYTSGGVSDIFGVIGLNNGELYGTQENPIPYIRRTAIQSGTSYTVGGLQTYLDTSASITLTNALYLASSDTTSATRRGFPLLVGSENAIDEWFVTGMEEIEDSIIYGKYKLKDTISNYPKLSYCAVPVTFSLDESIYNAFCFAPYRIPWSASVSGTVSAKWSGLFGVSRSATSWTTDTINSTKIALYKPVITDTNNSSYENLTYITDDFSLYAGKVVDFGDVPQHVPTIFKTWFESVADVYYPYSYTIKSADGAEQLSQLKDAPPMNNALLTTIGNQKTLALTDLDGQTYTMQWESTTPEGQTFLGLSTVPNSNRPTILANTENAISWVGDLVFYECYGKYRPPSTVFNINLYQNSAEVNRVDKGNYLVGVGTLSGALREECSMLTPSIVYQSADVPTFNYVYIPIFNRYYFVTSLSSVSKNVWRMELNCDVLMTYKNEIFLLQGVVGRQEIDFNPMLVDSELPTQDNPEVEIVNIPSTAFLSHTNITGNLHNFVLTVIG